MEGFSPPGGVISASNAGHDCAKAPHRRSLDDRYTSTAGPGRTRCALLYAPTRKRAETAVSPQPSQQATTDQTAGTPGSTPGHTLAEFGPNEWLVGDTAQQVPP